jgi:hypothetical protein
MPNDKKAIVALKALAPKTYEGIDLDRLAVYALCVLEQKKIPLYFDYASVALFRLFPKKFSMANFSKYPDTNRINKALRRLTDQTRKSWATGTVENGFSLTDLGREVGKQVLEILSNPDKREVAKVSAPTRSRGRSAVVDTVEIRDSEVFKKWSAKEPITNYEFFAFLKAASYTPKPLLVEHIDRLKNSATTANDKEVSSFLDWLSERFANLLK